MRVRDYVPSYGDRENTVETVKKCAYISSCPSLISVLTYRMGRNRLPESFQGNCEAELSRAEKVLRSFDYGHRAFASAFV